VFIKVLYVVLVLCTVALMGAVAAAYLKIRRHMRDSHTPQQDALEQVEQENQTGSHIGS
jgi:hypothetical protein